MIIIYIFVSNVISGCLTNVCNPNKITDPCCKKKILGINQNLYVLFYDMVQFHIYISTMYHRNNYCDISCSVNLSNRFEWHASRLSCGLRLHPVIVFVCRNCIGQNFAMHELKIILSRIIHRSVLQHCLNHV